jgi:hypothetical protein
MHYLLHIWGGVEPHVRGPYKSAALRNRAAKRFAQKEDRDDNDYFKMFVHSTKRVEVAPFTGDELGRQE